MLTGSHSFHLYTDLNTDLYAAWTQYLDRSRMTIGCLCALHLHSDNACYILTLTLAMEIALV